MAVLLNQDLTRPAGEHAHPVAVETIALIERALNEMRSTLLQSAARRENQDAAAAEYDSWRQPQRH